MRATVSSPFHASSSISTPFQTRPAEGGGRGRKKEEKGEKRKKEEKKEDRKKEK